MHMFPLYLNIILCPTGVADHPVYIPYPGARDCRWVIVGRWTGGFQLWHWTARLRECLLRPSIPYSTYTILGNIHVQSIMSCDVNIYCYQVWHCFFQLSLPPAIVLHSTVLNCESCQTLCRSFRSCLCPLRVWSTWAMPCTMFAGRRRGGTRRS